MISYTVAVWHCLHCVRQSDSYTYLICNKVFYFCTQTKRKKNLNSINRSLTQFTSIQKLFCCYCSFFYLNTLLMLFIWFWFSFYLDFFFTSFSIQLFVDSKFQNSNLTFTWKIIMFSYVELQQFSGHLLFWISLRS